MPNARSVRVALWQSEVLADPEANLRQADSASLRALELGPDVAEAHAARGLALTLQRDDETAARELIDGFAQHGRAPHMRSAGWQCRSAVATHYYMGY